MRAVVTCSFDDWRMTENARVNLEDERRRSRQADVADGGTGAASTGEAAISEDALFEDPFDRPKESAR
ncbi:MAG TPA: hypothetical protein VFT04_13870 [Gemmatimonadales bacterium]|nr:hypothetical protein [Gemmatimonadales bacterium]